MKDYSEMKFTKGNWKVSPNGFDIRVNKKIIATTATSDESIDEDECLANTRLIEAAPDMLYTLMYLVDRLEGAYKNADRDYIKSTVLDVCKRAIGKANQ